MFKKHARKITNRWKCCTCKLVESLETDKLTRVMLKLDSTIGDPFRNHSFWLCEGRGRASIRQWTASDDPSITVLVPLSADIEGESRKWEPRTFTTYLVVESFCFSIQTLYWYNKSFMSNYSNCIYVCLKISQLLKVPFKNPNTEYWLHVLLWKGQSEKWINDKEKKKDCSETTTTRVEPPTPNSMNLYSELSQRLFTSFTRHKKQLG